MSSTCPNCGSGSFGERRGDYRFEPPANIPGGVMLVKSATWEECENCGEQILPPELGRRLNELRYSRLGLLPPARIREIRETAGLTQEQMAQRLGVGAKTYTRWESGRSVHNKSSDNLIRLMDQAPDVLSRIEAQRAPERPQVFAKYFQTLGRHGTGTSTLAMAAHEGVVDAPTVKRIREQLRAYIGTKRPREAVESGLQAEFLELEASELAEYLLSETGQDNDEPTNPAPLLDYLKLTLVVLNLESMAPKGKHHARGMLLYDDRIVGVHENLKPQRARFTTLHEIGHFVLPHHQSRLYYLCNEQDLSFAATNTLEREANAFAAELLFKGDRFTRHANECEISAESIKTLALRYDASFEATARRFVERNARACMLAVFRPAGDASLVDVRQKNRWVFMYPVASAEFRTKFFERLKGSVPDDVAAQVARPGRDVADSVDVETTITSASGAEHDMRFEYFSNGYRVFALIQPA
ncbi:MAG: ImmA/IrrE family metallo-endopeptidase [Alphaproteobacteria bacterium]|nr:MAG: ImmA/IrrE family metallo-endopeptidase [Alphaproteobacteria bacterium]